MLSLPWVLDFDLLNESGSICTKIDLKGGLYWIESILKVMNTSDDLSFAHHIFWCDMFEADTTPPPLKLGSVHAYDDNDYEDDNSFNVNLIF